MPVLFHWHLRSAPVLLLPTCNATIGPVPNCRVPKCRLINSKFLFSEYW